MTTSRLSQVQSEEQVSQPGSTSSGGSHQQRFSSLLAQPIRDRRRRQVLLLSLAVVTAAIPPITFMLGFHQSAWVLVGLVVIACWGPLALFRRWIVWVPVLSSELGDAVLLGFMVIYPLFVSGLVLAVEALVGR
jgi:hypothetical protein